MHYTYILTSKKNGRHYYGSTCDINERLKKHNSGKVKSTKGYRPWEIHYFETYPPRSEAFQRRMYFKTLEGRKWLKSKGII